MAGQFALKQQMIPFVCLFICGKNGVFETQGGLRLQAWRATLQFEEKLAGRKEKNSTAIERLVCCFYRPISSARQNTILIQGKFFSFLFLCDSK